LTFTYYNLDRNVFGEIPCTCHGGVRAYNDDGGGGGGSGMLMVIVVRIAESSKSVQLAMTGLHQCIGDFLSDLTVTSGVTLDGSVTS
jgi:hypothetical protein